MTITYEIKTIQLKNGADVRTFATLNNGYTHIGTDDGCWIIINGKSGEAGFSAWIFKEAAEALFRLPPSPKQYRPYLEAVGYRIPTQTEMLQDGHDPT